MCLSMCHLHKLGTKIKLLRCIFFSFFNSTSFFFFLGTQMVGCCFLMLLTQDLVQLLQLNFGQFCFEIKFLGDWSRGYKHFCVESDSLVSTSLLNNECRSYHPCFIMIQDINIKEYALQGGSLKWNHTLRFCFFLLLLVLM